MLCDHTGDVFIGHFSFLNLIGRIAFPIFAFQIVQGYIHTHNVKKYALRLFAFACISQIPFMLFLSTFYDNYYLNVFFKLFLGVICIYGFDKIKINLSELLFGEDKIEERWNSFKKKIKGFGPAMMSEILCYTYPNEYMLWNRTALEAFSYLEIKNIPIHNYQITGKKYIELCNWAKIIRDEFVKKGIKDTDLLFVDYFFWDELKKDEITNNKLIIKETEEISVITNKSYHEEIVENIKNIGIMLGYNTSKSGRITNSGKIPDAVWEFNVGNIGQLKYVFEVQDNGNIDSLIVSLMNASQDISVQAVVAISDDRQIEKIKLHCKNIEDSFNGKLKFWKISDVERANEGLTTAMEIINNAINITK